MNNNPVTTASNLNNPDTSVAINDARRYFNNFYSKPFEVGPAGDAIVAFFEQRISNKQAAKNLAAVVIYTASAQNANPMTVLNEFQKLPPGELNNYLAAFMNINRAPTSYLGFKSETSTNPMINRTIII